MIRHKHGPGIIAAIYCDGKRDVHAKGDFLTSASLLSHNALHKLASCFGMASDRSSLASAEAYLQCLDYDDKTIGLYTRIVEKTVEQYMQSGVFEDENGRLPICTFNRDFYLGIHLDGHRISNPVILEELQSDIRKKLVMDRLGLSPGNIVAAAPVPDNYN